MASCCAQALNSGMLYLNANERPVGQSRADWKTCPLCSDAAGVHVYLKLSAFGASNKRITKKNLSGIHSDCVFHRSGWVKGVGSPNAGKVNPGPTLPCRAVGGVPHTVRHSGQTQSSLSASASETMEAEVGDVPLSPEQLDVLIGAMCGAPELTEEGRKSWRTHLEAERKPGNRKAILQLRTANGSLNCDACGADLAKRYGADHAEIVEVHHRIPLARGNQKPKVEDFALLCPTCHRVVHYRRLEPLAIEDLRRRLK